MTTETQRVEFESVGIIPAANVETVDQDSIGGAAATGGRHEENRRFTAVTKQRQHEPVRDMRARSRAAPQAAPGKPMRLLVVIDHRQARVYTAELRGSVPQRITPYDPGGFGRHLHYVQDDASGQRKPERKSFYEAVAKTLQNAEQVLIFGSGTGASSAMERLLKELKRHHPDVAKRVVGSIVVNAQHMSGDQLLAQAREFYAAEGRAKRT